MTRTLLLVVVLIFAQGFSELYSFALYNNTNQPVEICNLNPAEPTCQLAESQTLARVLMVGDRSEQAWHFRISTDGRTALYHLPGSLLDEAIRCSGHLWWRRCEVPAQLDSNGEVRWTGTVDGLPLNHFPNQPAGFPIEPDV